MAAELGPARAAGLRSARPGAPARSRRDRARPCRSARRSHPRSESPVPATALRARPPGSPRPRRRARSCGCADASRGGSGRGRSAPGTRPAGRGTRPRPRRGRRASSARRSARHSPVLVLPLGEVEVQADASRGCSLAELDRASAAAGARTIRLALVTMPRSCASTMPALTAGREAEVVGVDDQQARRRSKPQPFRQGERLAEPVLSLPRRRAPSSAPPSPATGPRGAGARGRAASRRRSAGPTVER